MTTQEMPKQALAQLRHQLRSPLNHIIGYSEILLEDAANESAEVRSLLTNVHTSARVVLDLVTRLAASAGPVRTRELNMLREKVFRSRCKR